jgi:hypothetical protein
MMNHSESIASLAAALAKAQGEIENAAKNAANPHFKSRYADLAEILNTVRPVLAKHGLAVVQMPGWLDGRVTVDTMLTHSSGEWIRGTSEAPVQKADPQGVGSATTYLRRYSLAAVCGIAQEDDDGSAASTPRQQSAPETRRNGNAVVASEKQLAFADKLIRSSVFTEEEREKVTRKCAGGDRDVVSAAIEWMQEQIAERKALKAVGA